MNWISACIVIGVCFLFLLPQIIKLIVIEIKIKGAEKEIKETCDRIQQKLNRRYYDFIS